MTFFECLEHESDPVDALRSAHRVLEPGGLCLVEVPNWRSPWRALFGRYWMPLLMPQHLSHFDPTSLRTAMERAGFEVVHWQGMVMPIAWTASLGVVLYRLLGVPPGIPAERTLPRRVIDRVLGWVMVGTWFTWDVPTQIILRLTGFSCHQAIVGRSPLSRPRRESDGPTRQGSDEGPAHGDGRPLAPWFDPIGDTPVLDASLRHSQEQAIAAAGCPRGCRADRQTVHPSRGPTLVHGGGPETGRTRSRAGSRSTMGFSEGAPSATSGAGGHRNSPTSPRCAPIRRRSPRKDDLGLDGMPPFNKHMRHALRPVRVGPAMAHHLDHWSHVVRVNQLALVAIGEEARFWWDTSGWIPRLWQVLKLLWRARKPTRRAIFHHLLPVSPKAQIHETAVVEASRVAAGAYIGPHAVVRGSVIGPGARIEDSATVNLSSVGANSQVERFAMVNLCVLYPGACMSRPTASGQAFWGGTRSSPRVPRRST